jgi:hypothetical protein
MTSVQNPVNDTASVDGASVLVSHHADLDPSSPTQRCLFERSAKLQLSERLRA